MNELVLITGVSASGKTTLQEEMLKRGWSRPYNFTTRKPRNEEELDEYIFLSKEQFFSKLDKGDFLEFTTYGGNFYGVSKSLFGERICIIVDPIGRSQIIEKVNRMKIDYNITSVFLDITPELQEERLRKRGDSDDEITKRELDFKWFHPTPNCLILDGERNTEEIFDELEIYLLRK